MNPHAVVALGALSTGVPGLDEVLGGGLPEHSLSLIAGGPGGGKTTLAHQIMFANASPECPALYFTVLGEPTLKMLRYQQQFDFFDPAKLNGAIRFINLSDEVLANDLGQVLESLVRAVETSNPSLVFVDSFRTLVRSSASREAREMDLQVFVQRLALHLTGWQATTFLIGEYLEGELRENPVFTVADGILWLSQSVERNSMVRKLQVMKMRGRASMPGLHTLRITGAGVDVFPRLLKDTDRRKRPQGQPRLSFGVPGLDQLLAGGIPAGDGVLVAGPAGSGKSVLATQFIAEGVTRGEPGVIAVFEEYPQEYIARAAHLGLDLEAMVQAGLLKILYLRPLDLSVDEALLEIRHWVDRLGATRVAIDSLSGFELALAPTFREDFRESLYRMVGALTGIGATVLMTVEVIGSFSDLRFTPHAVSFLSDDIILLRYFELESQLRRVMTVAKMRGSAHSKDLREFTITDQGLVVGQTLSAYRGILTGGPVLIDPRPRRANRPSERTDLRHG
jgi:circadian clock protein KaiC